MNLKTAPIPAQDPADQTTPDEAPSITPATPGRLMRRQEVERDTGLSCSGIYKMMSQGTFPRPRRIGTHAVAWLSSEIDAWKLALPVADPNDV